jgi:VWFA-related protein
MANQKDLLSLLAVATVVPLVLFLANAQDKQENTQLDFRAHADLVLIPATVSDKSGHITGLKKEDFTVLEDGAEQQIATFEEIRTDQRRLLPPEISNGFSNFVDGKPSTSRITLIVLDLINTPFAAQAAGRQQLFTYLMQSLDAREPTALYTLTRSGLRVIHDFTTDPRVLVATPRSERRCVPDG